MSHTLKVTLVTLILLMTIGVNAPDNILSALGIEPRYLKTALVLWIVLGLYIYRGLAVIVLTTLLAIGANLPAELARLWGIDSFYFIVTLVIMIISPIFWRFYRR